jgi:prophage regulatory protein
MPKYYRLKELQAGPVPASTSTIYGWIAAGEFPRPLKIGPRMVAWPAEDIQLWLDQRAELQRQGDGQ